MEVKVCYENVVVENLKFMFNRVFKDYLKIPQPVLMVIIAEFFIQLVNTTFMNIQPLYMSKVGFADDSIAGFISYRFLGVLALALPLGIMIRGRRVKNLFYISAFCVPLFALLIVYSIDQKITWMLYASQLLWGASFTFMQIPVMPYILRNTEKSNQTAAISLSFATWSFASILGGLIVAGLNSYDEIIFSERNLLALISIVGFLSVFFVFRMKGTEQVQQLEKARLDPKGLDWNLITRALIPTLIIAVGAGLTIPFISLFFYKVHNMDTDTFSLISSVSAILVAIGAMLVPRIKKGIGYRVAVPTTQSFAILALVLMATTQYYNDMTIAVHIAVGCYLLRQPLMNMAGPMTSEIAMSYVGKKNQEITSALTSAIWSGSWWISTRIIFQELYESGFDYVNIFLVTAALYALGVIWYYVLILDYNKREKMGLIKT
jgi:predicted MFS family arabinose efflux permease